MTKTLAVLFILFIFPASVHAVDTTLLADTVEQTGELYVARGGVNIRKAEMLVTADYAVYNGLTGEATLQDNVKIESPLFEMKAEAAEFNIQEETGTLHNAEVFVKKGNYHLKSREMYKSKGMNFLLSEAAITTCDSPVPEWCFKGRKIKVTLGEEATGRDVSFRVKGLPVLYTPYIWVPILTDRTTGLLLPTVGFNDTRGFYWRQPFFIVLSENRDATLYLDYYSKRGIGTAAEYRYIERGGYEGRFYLFHIKDRKLREDFFEIKGQNVLRDRATSVRLGLDYVNESRFVREYKVDIAERTRRFLISYFETDRRFDNSRLYLRGDYLIELKEGVNQSSILQRLPELDYVSCPEGLGRFSFSYGAALTNFTRAQGVDGQRLSATVKAGHTIGKDITLYQSVSFRESFYKLDDIPAGTDENRNHDTLAYNAGIESRLIARYGAITHTVTPSLSYRYTREAGDEPPLFDSVELRPPRSAVELSLMNRLFDRDGEFMTFKAAEELDSDDRETAKFALTLKRPITVRLLTTYDLRDGTFGDSNLNASASLLKTGLTFGRQYSKSSDVVLYSLSVTRDFSTLSLGSGISYDTEQEEMTNFTADAGYRGQCWGMRVSFVQRPDDWSVFFTLELKGLGAFGGKDLEYSTTEKKQDDPYRISN